MSSPAAFTGSVPRAYQQYLVPLIFQQYADDIAARLKQLAPKRILELACGTGVVTRAIAHALPNSAITATDLNPGMLDVARESLAPAPSIKFEVINACSLPYADRSFDAIVCQYGVMFFPDKVAAMREARRVLVPGGKYIFNVWDSIEHNPIAQHANDTVVEMFPSNPPNFLRHTPYAWFDHAEIERVTRDGGFTNITIEAIAFDCIAPAAEHAARGYIEGTPVWPALQERGITDASPIIRSVAQAIAAKFGDKPCRSTMRAIIITAS